jgi:hypothetical protein
MKVEADRYTKFILTAIAIGLFLNAASMFFSRLGTPVPAFAGAGSQEMRISDFRSTWPLKVEITNWPQKNPSH